MRDLHHATLLDVLKRRFFKDIIYTYLGPIVVCINPFKWTIPWYQNEKMIDYIKQHQNVYPHAWKIADQAFRAMNDGKGNQTMLISGESGAGKTECAKSVIAYLSKLSCSLLEGRTDPETKQRLDIASKISERIKECSPILEAFGNAKTINNDNSSRFGKFIKLQFDSDGIIVGAHTINYLLEKSRLCNAGQNERSYHIFYQMCAGFSEEQKKTYFINSVQEFKSLTDGNCTTVESIDDVADFKEVMNAMKIINITQEEQDYIWRICASILHLYNLTFSEGHDGSTQIDNIDIIKEKVSKLLHIEDTQLEACLIKTKLKVMSKEVIRNLNVASAGAARDAMCQSLYSSLFDWIIEKINSRVSASSFDRFIGLLDIFGFETFEKNSFEQFCINYANETLQYHYNTYNFKRDMEECKAEGIDVTSIKAPNNTPCINLIQGKGRDHGLFSYLDQSCIFPNGDDNHFLNSVTKVFGNGQHKYFIRKNGDIDSFTIRHFAGPVKYSMDEWVVKNKDELKPDILETLRSSNDAFISSLVKDPVMVNRKPLTVGGAFKTQVGELMNVINSTTPHWARCIKSHPSKKPNQIHGKLVMNQLSSSGVLETIKIRREGYCFRIPHQEFVLKYKPVMPSVNCQDYRTGAEQLIQHLNFTSEQAQVGKTKVFMRIEPYNLIEKLYAEKLSTTVSILQKYGRMCIARVAIERRLAEIEREKKRKELASRKAELDLLAALQADVNAFTKTLPESNVAHNFEQQMIVQFKEDAKKRRELLQEEHYRTSTAKMILKEKILLEEEQLRLAEEKRLAEIECLRAEKELKAKIEHQRQMEMIRAEQEERRLKMAKEAEERRLEYERKQREEMVEKRERRIREHREKLERRQNERRRYQETSEKAFLQAREKIEAEKREKEQRRLKRYHASKKKDDLISKTMEEYAIQEEERLRQSFQDELNKKYEQERKAAAWRAKLEYAKKIKFEEKQRKAKKLQKKMAHLDWKLGNREEKKKVEKVKRAAELESKMEGVRRRREERNKVIQERRRLKLAMEEISKDIRLSIISETGKIHKGSLSARSENLKYDAVKTALERSNYEQLISMEATKKKRQRYIKDAIESIPNKHSIYSGSPQSTYSRPTSAKSTLSVSSTYSSKSAYSTKLYKSKPKRGQFSSIYSS